MIRSTITYSIIILIISSLTGLGLPRTASAQTSESEVSNELEEVIVTATKRKTNLQKTPVRVDVFDKSYLHRSSVRKFAELSEALPNMVVPEGISGTQNVTIRGVSSPGRGFGIEQPVGAYIDGVFGPPGSLDSYLLDMQQIEVIRGPQGAVWGRNTLAGAISYSSANPTDVFSGFIRGQLGNKGLQDLQFALSGPLRSDKVRYRLAGAKFRRDGFSDRTSGGTYGDKDLVAVRGNIEFLPNDNLDIRLIADYSKNDYFSSVLEYINGPFAELAGTDGYTRSQDTDYYLPSQTKSQGTTLLVDYDFNGLTLSSIIGYRAIDRKQFLDSDGTVVFLINENINSETDQWSQEFRLSNGDDVRARWMAGLYFYQREDDDIAGSKIEASPFGFPGAILEEGVHQNQETRSYAAFATLDYSFTDRLSLQAGIRFTREKKDQDSSQSSVLVLPNGAAIPLFEETYMADLSESYTSPMLGLTFQVNDNAMAYFSWGRGNKSGGFNSPRASVPIFDPEQADSFEGGVKTTWKDGKVLLNVIGFYIDYTDMQIRGLEVTPTGVVQAFYNAGAMTSKGLELEMVVRPAENWNLTALFGYNDAEFDEFIIRRPGGLDIDLAGNVPAFAPETSFSLRSDWFFNAGGLGEGYFNFEWNYTGDYFLDFLNIPVAGKQKAYSLLNARLGLIHHSGFDLALWGRNLTDEDYKVDFIGDLPPVIFQGSQAHLLAPGRTYGIEATYRF